MDRIRLLLMITLLLCPLPAHAGETEIGAASGPATWPPSYTHEELIDVPEPLLFDLIRRPDSTAGELEINTLVGVPLRGRPRVVWSPEIEYAFAHGHAVELEFDVDHDLLERIQIGLQGTFSYSRNLRFIHGWQALIAYDLAEQTAVGTGLYMFAARMSPRLSSWLLVGGRVVGPTAGAEGHAEGQRGSRGYLVVNPSLYLRLHRPINLALEANVIYGPGEVEAFLLGEVEWDLTPSLQFQVGLGPRWENNHAEAFLALRLTWDRD